MAEDLRVFIKKIIDANTTVINGTLDFSEYQVLIPTLIANGKKTARDLLKQEWDETKKISI